MIIFPQNTFFPCHFLSLNLKLSKKLWFMIAKNRLLVLNFLPLRKMLLRLSLLYPRDRNPLGVNRHSRSSFNLMAVWKGTACLVAKAYTQAVGIDYSETFSLVVKMITFRTLLSLAAAKGWHLQHLNIILHFFMETCMKRFT